RSANPSRPPSPEFTTIRQKSLQQAKIHTASIRQQMRPEFGRGHLGLVRSVAIPAHFQHLKLQRARPLVIFPFHEDARAGLYILHGSGHFRVPTTSRWAASPVRCKPVGLLLVVKPNLNPGIADPPVIIHVDFSPLNGPGLSLCDDNPRFPTGPCKSRT